MTPDQLPLSTYRIQFNPAFPFEAARGLVPYLSRLGVTHLYSSPVLRSRAGGSHGYDVVDCRTLNPELGGETEFRSLASALQAHGMGLVLDIVPNHMAASGENPYWQDVLTYGLGSPYARWFDIDWRHPDPELWGRVVVPVLGAPLPDVIRQDQLSVVWKDGRFSVQYYEHLFPIDPATIPEVLLFGIDDLHAQLEPGHSALLELTQTIRALQALPRRTTRMRSRNELPLNEIREALSRLARLIESSPVVRDWALRTCENFSRGDDGRRRLRRLLGAQSYRLAHWRRAATILNYRRFFDINDLISLRQEDPEVFKETHELILRWVHESLLDGLRIDHLDGLRDPLGYLQRLSEMVASTLKVRRPYPIFVEKILAPNELLPSDWPVAGTTGYEFMNQAEAIFVSPEGLAEIEQNYRQMLRRPVRFRQISWAGKHRVLRNELSAFVGRLAEILLRLASYDPDTSELTHRELVEAIAELVVCLPVYRTYVDARQPTVREQDRKHVEEALVCARRRQRATSEALEFLADVLLLKNFSSLPENEQQERMRFIERFQQLTGPAAAKGVEDTALYAYVPLVSLNEVGGEPDLRLEKAVARLHECNLERFRSWPRNMLAATTHDTKRTADGRSRLDVLSEIPRLWWGYVKRWRQANRPLRTQIGDRRAPDSNSEYLLYQTLVAIWPAPPPRRPEEALPESDFPSAEAVGELRERVEQYMLKAIREAKTRTSWVDPDEAYENAVVSFIRRLISINEENSKRFLRDINQFVARIARPGFWNALSRAVIQFTAPGIPDVYQGDELWNFALVDPDNRRPVDYDTRRQLLDESITAFESGDNGRQAFLRDLVQRPEDGRIKLHTVRSLLHVRREQADLFLSGDYEPLHADGAAARHVFAFARCTDSRCLLVVVPRLSATLLDNPADAPIGETVWRDTTISLSDQLRGVTWRSVLSGGMLDAAALPNPAELRVADLLNSLPAAVLLAERRPSALANG